MNKSLKYIFTLSVLFIPFFVGAQGEEYTDFMNRIQGILSSLIPIIIAIGVITFFYGLIKFIRSVDQPEQREEGRRIIVYGIIAIFVMISMWGLVNVVVGTVFDDPDDLLIEVNDVPQADGW